MIEMLGLSDKNFKEAIIIITTIIINASMNNNKDA